MVLYYYKFQKFVFRHLVPARMRYPLARAIARMAYFLNAGRRSVIESNLTPLVGPERAAQVGSELLGNFVETAVDFFCARPHTHRPLTYEGWSHLEQAYQENRRVIVVTAHLGNWEVGISTLVNRGFSVAGLYATYRDDDIVQWIASHRHTQVQWIPTTPGASDLCVAALEQGKLLCIAADIPFGEHGRRVHIAGHNARLPLGPWAIALRAKATVIPAFVLRKSPGHYHGIIHAPIKAGEGTLRHQLSAMQDAYRAHLEHYLTTYPEQWGNLQPFWERS